MCESKYEYNCKLKAQMEKLQQNTMMKHNDIEFINM